MKKDRENWSGQLGFVLAAAASAVGLGNLWRFPASAATYGGGIFLVIYVILTLILGIPLLMTEISLGRATRLSPSRTFHSLSPRWSFVGILGMIIPIVILPYYCVVGGWVVKYTYAAIASVFSKGDALTSIDFGSWATSLYQPGVSGLVFALGIIVLILLGVKNGIERSNKIMMPALLILTVAIAVFVLCMQGNSAGIKYYLVPDMSRLCADGHLSVSLVAKTLLSAMSQMFFSLSLAMGIMITYGSYVRKEDSIPKATSRIVMCDTFVAFVAGLIVIPTAYAFGGAEVATQGGAGLMFISLPKVFAAMGGAGAYVASAFFLLVLFAALTSAISIAETVTSSLCDFTGWRRHTCALLSFAWIIIGGAACVWRLDILDKADFLANNVLMPICAFFCCIFVGWIVKPKFILDEVKENVLFGRKFYSVIMRYVAPVLISVIFVTSVLSGLGVIKI